MPSEQSGWCTIESDPGVFTELLRELGAKGLQVEELYGLDECLLEDLHPIYGFIFLFKWDATIESKRKKQASSSSSSSELVSNEIFFAQQTVQNACATQAILSILLNIPSTAAGVELGNELSSFREFTRDLSPELRGEAIGASELIRNVHNSFGRPELAAYMVEEERRQARRPNDEEPFHFISILPIGDTLFEFDGLKPSPISHGKCGDSWTSLALKVIQQKILTIQEVGDSEIRFNLMALIKERATFYRERIDQQIRLICQLEDSLRLHPPKDGADSEEDPRKQQIETMITQNVELESRLEEEQLKTTQYQRENARRRHNFIPLAVALLREMARNGALDKYIRRPSSSPPPQ